MSNGNQMIVLGSKMFSCDRKGWPDRPSLGKMDRCLTKFKWLKEFVVDRLSVSANLVAWCGGSEAISSTDLELPVSAVSSFQKVKVVRKLGDMLIKLNHVLQVPESSHSSLCFSSLANDGDQRYTHNSGNFCLCLDFYTDSLLAAHRSVFKREIVSL